MLRLPYEQQYYCYTLDDLEMDMQKGILKVRLLPHTLFLYLPITFPHPLPF